MMMSCELAIQPSYFFLAEFVNSKKIFANHEIPICKSEQRNNTKKDVRTVIEIVYVELMILFVPYTDRTAVLWEIDILSRREIKL